MTNTAYQIRKEIIERLSKNPALRDDNLELALQKIGEASADLLAVEDVSFWQLSRTGENLICIGAYNKSHEHPRTITRIGIDEIRGYVPAIQEVLYLDITDLSHNTNINRLARKFLDENDDIRASLHVPLYTYGAFNGVVQFGQVGATREWNLLDHVFACQIADLAAETTRKFVTMLDERYIPDTLDLLGDTLDSLLDAMDLSDGMIRLDEIPVTRGYKPEVALKFTELYRSSPIAGDHTLVIQDINKSQEDTQQLVEILKDEDVRSVIVAPMLIDGERVGCVLVSSPVVMKWEPEEIAMVARTARYAAHFVEDVWIHQDALSLSGLIRQFQASSQKLNHMMMFQEAIQEVGRSAADILETNMAFIVLRNPDNIIDSPWVSGLAMKRINQIVTIESESIESILRNNKWPVLFPDVVKSILPDTLQRYLMEKNIQAARIFPLVYEDQTLGAVFGFYRHARLYTRNERSVLGFFANTATLALQNAWMYGHLQQGYLNLALELAITVDARETAEADIRWRLAELAEETAHILSVPESTITTIHWAALLHDIGKKDVPEEVLQKSGPLNEEEWELVYRTPVAGEKMLEPVPHLQEVARVVRNYREHYDGRGYPDRLRGDQIPIGAKVLAVADAYTSMVAGRPYRKPCSPKEALVEIQRHSGTQFDPAVVSAFSQVVTRVQ